jgi:hypothetical protein
MASLLQIRLNRSLAVAILAFSAAVAVSQVKVTIDHNAGKAATSAFKFKNVPSPVKNNAAAKATLKLVVGRADGNSAGLKALTDGILPENDDDPSSNFFFNAGSDGGRFLLDLGASLEIAQVNTYSWHANSRGPQVYNLFLSDGTDAKFNPAPDSHTDPATCGWKLIATVDTRLPDGANGGQYGVSITDASGKLGKFRYLLFDSIPTEYDDPWGNTFFSEVNVIAHDHALQSVANKPEVSRAGSEARRR